MATLQITKKLYVIPLIDVQIATSAERYVTGVRLWLFGWREHGEVEAQGPLPAYYLIDNPKRCAQINRFDGCHEESLRKDIGFFLGLLHGGVLTPDGTLRPDAKTLVFLHTQDFREGYECGRWDYFTYYEEIVQKDNDLLDPGRAKHAPLGDWLYRWRTLWVTLPAGEATTLYTSSALREAVYRFARGVKEEIRREGHDGSFP
jgi:hypothetical protein